VKPEGSPQPLLGPVVKIPSAAHLQNSPGLGISAAYDPHDLLADTAYTYHSTQREGYLYVIWQMLQLEARSNQLGLWQLPGLSRSISWHK
jgi:hypothetical protein